jgi:hypothetical protein
MIGPVRMKIHAPHLAPKIRQEQPPAPYVAPPAPYDPTPAELAVNFGGAMLKIAAGMLGRKPILTTEEEYQERLATCEACPLWDGNARAGYGSCRHPKCGCGRGKLYFKLMKCPLAKWPDLEMQPLAAQAPRP